MALGQETDRIDGPRAFGLAHAATDLAAVLPALLVEARRVASVVAGGWHGRRRAGPGETFWQFRAYSQDEPAQRIDWRRSARDDHHLYVREREWEAAHTLWLWPDLSPSMAFRSRLASASKRDRAVVLTLALADLLARGGERVGIPGHLPASPNRRQAERIAAALPSLAPRALPDPSPVRRFSDVVIVGDFLDPIETVSETVDRLAGTGANGHLVQVLDPVEEIFPFAGHTEFREIETGLKLRAGRAETWAEAYRDRLAAHRLGLERLAERHGWSFLLHRTDRPATELLLPLHARLAGSSVSLAEAGLSRLGAHP